MRPRMLLQVLGSPVEHRLVPCLRAVLFSPGHDGKVDADRQHVEQKYRIVVGGIPLPRTAHLLVVVSRLTHLSNTAVAEVAGMPR